jgi:hypothetical protein
MPKEARGQYDPSNVLPGTFDMCGRAVEKKTASKLETGPFGERDARVRLISANAISKKSSCRSSEAAESDSLGGLHGQFVSSQNKYSDFPSRAADYCAIFTNPAPLNGERASVLSPDVNPSVFRLRSHVGRFGARCGRSTLAIPKQTRLIPLKICNYFGLRQKDDSLAGSCPDEKSRAPCVAGEPTTWNDASPHGGRLAACVISLVTPASQPTKPSLILTRRVTHEDQSYCSAWQMQNILKSAPTATSMHVLLVVRRVLWILKCWWARQDLNLGPTDYESAALTAELQAHSFHNILHSNRLVNILRFRRNEYSRLGASSGVSWNRRGAFGQSFNCGQGVLRR